MEGRVIRKNEKVMAKPKNLLSCFEQQAPLARSCLMGMTKGLHGILLAMVAPGSFGTEHLKSMI